MTASVTHGRALRYAKGSARGLLHHPMGHYRSRRIRSLEKLPKHVYTYERQARGIPVAKTETRTRHTQITNEIRSRIVDGDWPPGHQLAKETDLAEQYGVSRMTMNKALTQLAQEGFVIRKKRRGTVVAEPRMQAAVLNINIVADEVAALGKRYEWRLLKAETRKLALSDLRHLGVQRPSLSEPSLVLQGVHYADDEPFCLEARAINLISAPSAKSVDFALEVPGSWLLRSLPWTSARHALRAVNVIGDDAKLLDHAVGTACLEVLRKTEVRGNWVTYARLLYPGDTYQLIAEFGPNPGEHVAAD